jgi:hypothetical protein
VEERREEKKRAGRKYKILESRGNKKSVPLTCAYGKGDRQPLSDRQGGGVGEDLCLMKRPKSPCVLCRLLQSAGTMMMDEAV